MTATAAVRPDSPSSTPPLRRAPAATAASRAVDAMRIALGMVFLWAFLDKTFGLGYSTASKGSWLNGGSPTKGFLGHVEVGPLQSAFRSMAGSGWVNWLFMLALLGVGAALLTGVALRITAVAGTVLLVLMWAAEWPLAQYTSTGDPTGSSHPFLDYHLIYALGLLVVAALGTASSWGLGQWWSKLPIVSSRPFLQ